MTTDRCFILQIVNAIRFSLTTDRLTDYMDQSKVRVTDQPFLT